VTLKTNNVIIKISYFWSSLFVKTILLFNCSPNYLLLFFTCSFILFYKKCRETISIVINENIYYYTWFFLTYVNIYDSLLFENIDIFSHIFLKFTLKNHTVLQLTFIVLSLYIYIYIWLVNLHLFIFLERVS